MTQDEIIRMAREVWGERAVLPFNDLERFAAIVAADLFTYDQVKAHIHAAVISEREACAKVCEEGTALTAYQSKDCYSYARNRAAAIRARSEK